jgi:hypothetical protein
MGGGNLSLADRPLTRAIRAAGLALRTLVSAVSSTGAAGAEPQPLIRDLGAAPGVLAHSSTARIRPRGSWGTR